MLPLVSSIFFKKEEKVAYSQSRLGSLVLNHRTLISKLQVDKRENYQIFEKTASDTSTKLQWLWNVTKPIRDNIYVRHDALETFLYQPLENYIRRINEKNVRK